MAPGIGTERTFSVRRPPRSSVKFSSPGATVSSKLPSGLASQIWLGGTAIENGDPPAADRDVVLVKCLSSETRTRSPAHAKR
jgi:hypothetical protein